MWSFMISIIDTFSNSCNKEEVILNIASSFELNTKKRFILRVKYYTVKKLFEKKEYSKSLEKGLYLLNDLKNIDIKN